MRSSGILFPIFSLPGKYGIGAFSEEAREFADFLKEAGQSCWQILPLGPVGYGDSPYQSFSVFAGNPYFIDLDQLKNKGLLTEEEAKGAEVPLYNDPPKRSLHLHIIEEKASEKKVSVPDDETILASTRAGEEAAEDPGAIKGELTTRRIDYASLYRNRYQLLKKAYHRADLDSADFRNFTEENAGWLPDYALFMALKDHFGGKAYYEWENDIRLHKPDAVRAWSERLLDEVRFYEYLQFEFYAEWKELKAYINSLGIRIVGDIPVYVSPDGADLWAHPELFQVDSDNITTNVAGVPPDGFTADGQLWGNPLYNWDYHRATGYEWWIRRLKQCTRLYDVTRIDHFRSFDEYYSVPHGEKTARNGVWKKGPGMEFFRAVRENLGDFNAVAEDLGFITDSVRQLVKDSGFPNMKVLEFAFDSRDSSGSNIYLPYEYDHNCVVYTGTHDNETLAGWVGHIKEYERRNLLNYLGLNKNADTSEIVNKAVRLAESSTADLCIIPLQDWLGLDNAARINYPSKIGGNWAWRLDPEMVTKALADRIRNVTAVYGRMPI